MPPWRKSTWCSAMPRSSTAAGLCRFRRRRGRARARQRHHVRARDRRRRWWISFDGRTRAFLQVQNGCDHRCTFCIIPYGRGQFAQRADGRGGRRKRAAWSEQGFAEIVLTGVDLTSYGADLPGAPTLGALVRKLLKLVPELKRLRLSSIDSIEADADLMRAIAEEERLMPHFHLSAQSGDDMILKRMKRRHARADTIAFCDAVRRLRPDAAFGADLIAGFPTETEAMFENTPGAGRRCRAVVPACLSRSARAPARRPRGCRSCRARWSRSAPRGCARKARRRWRRAWRRWSAADQTVLVEKRGIGPHAPVSRRSRFDGGCSRGTLRCA